MEPLLPPGRARLPTVVAWAAGLLTLVALAHRFRMAPDLTDESFSIAMPYRYVLGDRPFVDEISIQQTAGLVLFPFVWLFVKLTGGSTGLVLFVRAVHFVVFKGVAGFATYLGVRRWLRNQASAIALAFLPVAFVPHSIPNVGYNVIGSTMLVAGSFLLVGAFGEPDRRRRDRLCLAAGFCQGVMSLAYPPMAAAALLAAPLVLVCAPRDRLRAFAAFALGGIAVVLLVLPALRFGGVAGVKRALAWGVHASESHGKERFLGVLTAFREWSPTFFAYAAGTTLIAGLTRSRTLIAVTVAGSAMYLAFWNRDDGNGAIAALQLVLYAGLFAPFYLPAARPDRAVVGGAAITFLPSLAAGLAAGFTSTQGPNAAALGLDAAMVLGAALAARALERATDERLAPMLPAFGLTLLLVLRCYDFVYRDAPLAQLTETVHTGPFKGLRTSPERARIFAEFQQIVRTYDTPGGRLLYLYEDSAFYLFSKMPPSAHCVWEAVRGDLTGMVAAWQAYPHGKGIVVKLRGMPTTSAEAVLTPPDRKIRETPHFLVYRDQ